MHADGTGFQATCTCLKGWDAKNVEEACGDVVPKEHPMVDLATGKVEKQ